MNVKENLILHAARYADHAHRKQVRKYTNKPYITHPARVAANSPKWKHNGPSIPNDL